MPRWVAVAMGAHTSYGFVVNNGQAAEEQITLHSNLCSAARLSVLATVKLQQQ